MSFDLKGIEEKDGVLKFKLIREETIDGHDVGLFIMVNPNVETEDDEPFTSSITPMCECEFDYEIEERENGTKVHIRNRDPHDCAYIKAFREKIMGESRELHGEHWKQLGVKEAILDIHRRVRGGEYLGTCYGEMIYLQEVGELLGVPAPWDEAAELFKEERLQLNGAILCDFQQHVRFPRELIGLIRYMIEAPIGWPNGEAGEGFVYELYRCIEQGTEYRDGKSLFGHDFPYVRPERLLIMGVAMLASVMARAHLTRQGRKELLFTNLDHYAASLRTASDKLSELAEKAADWNGTLSEKAAGLWHALQTDEEEGTERFRFPREIRQLMRFLIGNGLDSADVVAELETAIGENGRWKHGAEAFWEHNYPNVAASEVAMFGLNWLASAIEQAQDHDVLCRFNRLLLQEAANDCDDLARDFDELHRRLRTQQGLARTWNRIRMRWGIWTWNTRGKLYRLKDRLLKTFRKEQKLSAEERDALRAGGLPVDDTEEVKDVE